MIADLTPTVVARAAGWSVVTAGGGVSTGTGGVIAHSIGGAVPPAASGGVGATIGGTGSPSSVTAAHGPIAPIGVHHGGIVLPPVVDFPPDDGSYALEVAVQDQAGNQTSVQAHFAVVDDGTCAAAPRAARSSSA